MSEGHACGRTEASRSTALDWAMDGDRTLRAVERAIEAAERKGDDRRLAALALARDVIRPHYAERVVDLLREGLEGCGVRLHRPEGASFLWLWMPGLHITNTELYERLKARGVIVVSGHHFFPGLEDDDWPHKHECIRITYADDWSRVERGLRIIVEEVRRACDGG